MKCQFNLGLLILFLFTSFIYSQYAEELEGYASYYADDFHGKQTSSGETYDQNQLTAAHRTLPFNPWVRVTNTANQKSVVVRINDRGPFARNRILDLSFAAGKQLGMIGPGSIYVKLEVINPPTNVQLEKEEVVIPELHSEEVNLRFRSKKINIPDIETLEDGLYNFNFKKIIQNGFAIQVASFSEFKNAKLFMSTIERIPHNQIYLQKYSNRFRVVIGIYNTRDEAEQQKKFLLTEFPNFIILPLN
ncbi:MAG: septal ring lytic transglycosylase RlpA family protein [Ignavibacteria bacterium]|nr:septal ring lytic transglycosylase RlpA family protein [Ignavibacteria bacterium]